VGRKDTLGELHGISTIGLDTLPNMHNKEHLECVPFPARGDNEVAEIRGGLTFHNSFRMGTRNVSTHGQVALFETVSMVTACSIRAPLLSEESFDDGSEIPAWK
jgi:hypothetical protein